MRIMPFMKRKKGVQFAGIGLDTGGGGGGGGSENIDITASEIETNYSINGAKIYARFVTALTRSPEYTYALPSGIVDVYDVIGFYQYGAGNDRVVRSLFRYELYRNNLTVTGDGSTVGDVTYKFVILYTKEA